VILEMTKLRVMGPRPRLHETLIALQDTGLLHLASREPESSLRAVKLAPDQEDERERLRAALTDVEVSETLLEYPYQDLAGAPTLSQPTDFARWAELGADLRPRLTALRTRLAELEEERALIGKYLPFLTAFEPLLTREASWTNLAVYHLALRREDLEVVDRLRDSLETAFGPAFEILEHALAGDEVALLLVVPRQLAPRVEQTLNQVRVQDIPVPSGFGRSLSEAAPRMLARLQSIPGDIAALEVDLRRIGQEHALELQRARAALRDRMAELDALPLSLVSEHAFVIEGWLPLKDEARLRHRLASDFGDDVVVEVLSRDEWGEEPPVMLGNPRFLQPFEAVMRLLPPPRYGTIDPTPLVAVFLPLFYGLMLGDVAYGLLVLLLGVVLHLRSQKGSLARMLAEIAGVCGLAGIVFGFAFGELLGDLGHRTFGLTPFLVNREEGLISLLALSVGLGLVHVLLGLGLGYVTARRLQEGRKAKARLLTAALLLAGAGALLARMGYLPQALLTPAIVAMLAGLPLLVWYEGFLAPVELLSTVGNVLSYARIMALGTASVMLALVANQLSEAAGSLLLGIIVGLAFHAVNLALGLFSPAIHALRLHYVEFFGKFYVSGGSPYRPFTHWRMVGGPAPEEWRGP
jgi:V/A-type H+-transporting ATPase subunit I